jgi:hypothetical protein
VMLSSRALMANGAWLLVADLRLRSPYGRCVLP